LATGSANVRPRHNDPARQGRVDARGLDQRLSLDINTTAEVAIYPKASLSFELHDQVLPLNRLSPHHVPSSTCRRSIEPGIPRHQAHSAGVLELPVRLPCLPFTVSMIRVLQFMLRYVADGKRQNVQANVLSARLAGVLDKIASTGPNQSRCPTTPRTKPKVKGHLVTRLLQTTM
jgi:hypothetical protein